MNNHQVTGNPIDFKALGKPGKHSVLRKEAFMKPRQAAQILYFGMKLFNRKDIAGWCQRGETISWRIERNGTARLHWLTATEYSPGLIRLRNDVIPSVPRKVWPFALPHTRNFELTFHWKEISQELGPNVFEFCNAIAAGEPFCHEWDLFEGEECYPQYAWTKRAKAAYSGVR